MAEQGEIFDYDFGPQHDNRQEGRRPAVIVQTDGLNRIANYALTIVAPLSTKSKGLSHTHIRVEPNSENGLTETSFVKCEQIYTVPVGQLGQRRGQLSRQDLYLVKEGLRIALAL